ncbi:MAG TPA: DUF2442 domain-containing protein [Flavobacteriales bacterium]|nr:DUF2442 domain-containing protein [Flavobacteriales bacterium]HMR28382.1 DUF2442 domain-containing protein [Flavobacteriales bacterium]
MRIAEVAVANGAVVLRLNNGSVFAEPLDGIVALKGASQKQVKNCEVFAGGVGIAWPKLDVHLSLKGFLSNMVRNELIRRFSMEPEPGAVSKRTGRKGVFV